MDTLWTGMDTLLIKDCHGYFVNTNQWQDMTDCYGYFVNTNYWQTGMDTLLQECGFDRAAFCPNVVSTTASENIPG